MSEAIYRYRFRPDVEPTDVEATLLLAVLACESLHGETQVRLDLRHLFDADLRTWVIDASTPVGADFNRLFAGTAFKVLSYIAAVLLPLIEEPLGGDVLFA